MKRPADPPRFAVWLLTRRLSAEWRDFVVGDLEEEFRTRRRDSRVAAHTWFWWQTVRCLATPPRSGPNRAQPASSHGDSPLRTLFVDLKFAFRTLFRTPFVTFVAIVSLALGIGATAAIFSVFHQVLLQSLAVPNPSELVNLDAPGPKPRYQSCGREGSCEAVFSYAMFRPA